MGWCGTTRRTRRSPHTTLSLLFSASLTASTLSLCFDVFFHQNSQQVLSGQLDASSLGVQALDDHTVRFTLNYADPAFLEALAHSSAMPCNQKLFESANGKYGSTIQQSYSNGPFFLMQWDNSSRIYLKKNDKYYAAEQVLTPGVTSMSTATSRPPHRRSGANSRPPPSSC